MILYPAIDIREGRAVRLVQGDYERQTVFDADPLDAARRWLEQGARALHVVDLDGARIGTPLNLESLRRICAEADVPVQAGGGLRTPEAVADALATGVERIVLGTAALEDPAWVESLVAENGERIVVGADARSGKVAVKGWSKASSATAESVIADLGRRGVSRFVFTPVEVDGTLGGPALDMLRGVAQAASAAEAQLIYSGGVGSLDDLRALAELRLPPVDGVIVGRALYEGRFTISDGEQALAGR